MYICYSGETEYLMLKVSVWMCSHQLSNVGLHMVSLQYVYIMHFTALVFAK